LWCIQTIAVPDLKFISTLQKNNEHCKIHIISFLEKVCDINIQYLRFDFLEPDNKTFLWVDTNAEVISARVWPSYTGKMEKITKYSGAEALSGVTGRFWKI
jgi:hypothetical protein